MTRHKNDRKIDIYTRIPGNARRWALTARSWTTGTLKQAIEDFSIDTGTHIDSIKAKFSDIGEEKRATNPAPRKGTASVKRPSQITGEAPTKRLVKRRKANTHEGYFPNPLTSAEKQNVKFEVFIYNAIEKAHDKKGASLVRQAKLSYAQGLIDAGYILKALTQTDAEHFLSSLRGTDK